MTDAAAREPAVIWDMGGIIYRYFTEVLLDMAVAEGWDLAGVPLGPTGPVPDPDYEAMNQGRIDEPTYLAIVEERLRKAGVEIDVANAIDWTAQTRPWTWELVAAIDRAGHAQALLTNDATKWLGARWWETWDGREWFAAVVDVATIGVRKPAPEPYLASAEALALAPSSCLFVDDMVVNCAGAEAVGMQSHHVDIRTPEAALERLAERLGLAPLVV